MFIPETKLAWFDSASSESTLIPFLLSFFVGVGFFAGLMVFINVAFNHQRNHIRRPRMSASSLVTKHIESIGTAVTVPYRDHPSDLESQVSHVVAPIVPLPPRLVSLSPPTSAVYNGIEGNEISDSLIAVDTSGNTSTLQAVGESQLYTCERLFEDFNVVLPP